MDMRPTEGTKWEIGGFAFVGATLGMFLAVVHEVYQASSGELSELELVSFGHIIGQVIAGGAGGALLLAVVASLHNRLARG